MIDVCQNQQRNNKIFFLMCPWWPAGWYPWTILQHGVRERSYRFSRNLRCACEGLTGTSQDLWHLHQIRLVYRRGAREKLVCWHLNGGKICRLMPCTSSLLFPPLPCSGSYLTVYTIFKSRLLKDLLGEKVQQNGSVQGNSVPWEYFCCSITE